MMSQFIQPNWPAPKNIQALTTTRLGGVSLAPFDSNNLALHVNDVPVHVYENRKKIVQKLQLKKEPFWLEQTHSTIVSRVENQDAIMADASITSLPDTPLVILTADCLPILLCHQEGQEIAAIHAGWKGLLNGIIQKTIEKMHSPPQEIIAWIGPAICQKCYTVHTDFKKPFLETYPETKSCFTENKADLPGIAQKILTQYPIKSVHLSNICTYEQKNQYYSYRRSAQTGRMATLIWFNR